MYVKGNTVHQRLELANNYAKDNSGCLKVHVGSVIVQNGSCVSLGANKSVPDLCKAKCCLRVEKYGDDSKNHRNPEDCRAIHSEVDAICNAARNGISVVGSTIYVTRYPCEACARAIVQAGIIRVIYGRSQLISEETARILESGDVDVYNASDWTEEDTER